MTKSPFKLTTLHVKVLRDALADPLGICRCDGSTGGALERRGYAVRRYMPAQGTNKAWAHFITDAGRRRARLAADIKADNLSAPEAQGVNDPSLMQNLTAEDAEDAEQNQSTKDHQGTPRKPV